jgi:hypothetical protein
MKSNGASERHQNNNLKAVIAFANFLGTDTTFLEIQLKEQITSFLDTKIKNVEEDPDKKWMTTWNDYLHRIKHYSMTLLVLEIAVPQLSHSEAATELPKQLLELWPVILSYATSFIILGFFGLPTIISSTTLNEQIEPFSG